MQQLIESYKATIQKMEQRADELKKQMKGMPSGSARDRLAERRDMIIREVWELERTLGELVRREAKPSKEK